MRRGSREQRVGACTDQESERYRGHGGTLAHGVENDDMAGQLHKRGRRAYQKALVAAQRAAENPWELAFLNWALVELVERARSSLDEIGLLLILPPCAGNAGGQKVGADLSRRTVPSQAVLARCERWRAGRCTGAMDAGARSRWTGIAAALLITLVVGSGSAQPTQAKASPRVPVKTFAGGCAGTVLTDAEPPVWSQAGWSHAKGTPWPVPWAFGSQDTTVAFLFSTVLVAGSGPRVDGSYNKVGWVGKGDYSIGNTDIAIEARPFGESQPVLTSPGDANASVVDLPKPGCWTFRLSWSAHGQQQVSTINLEVLPAGARP